MIKIAPDAGLIWSPILLAAFLGSLSGCSDAAALGSKAPALHPSKWLNSSGDLSWESLSGRVILVEKWATW
ncbi:MAG: hypothetical protein HY717_06885 [Planctomycetes bacterium]|nr:hypothetical protein [Planctomycetota bacterium]